MKTIDADMRTHLDGVVTSLATIWRLTRTDGTVHYFCDHDKNIVYGGNTYLAREGFQRSAIDNHADLAVDNLDLTSLFGTEITKIDVRAGALDYAEIEVSAVNWANPDVCGEIKLRRGYLGEVKTEKKGEYKAEMRGMTQLLSMNILETYSPECRADLGDARCGIPIYPGVLPRNSPVELGDFYRVATTAGTGQEQYENRVYEVTIAGTTAVGQPTYDTTIGNTTVDGTATLTARDAFMRDAVVTNVTDNRIFAIDVIEPRAVDGWFIGGAVCFESGNNVGKALEIKGWTEATSTVTLFLPTYYDIQVGDTLRLYAGCDKSRDTCKDKFSNVINFRGEPDLPSNDKVSDYPTTEPKPAGFSWGGLIVGLIGAAIGAKLGGQAGAQFGYLIGSLVGSFLFPGSPARGPRLNDLTVGGSAYGAPIARGYGVIRKAGNIIWTSGLHEKKKTHGSGFGAPKTVEYVYDASFAVSFGVGPAVGITRIWAGPKLIYDITHEPNQLPDNFVKIKGLSFRFYPGNETQTVDPLIARKLGAGRAPAFRGQTYIVFDKLPLKMFGNQIPGITAEVVYEGTDVLPEDCGELGVAFLDGPLEGASTVTFAVDWQRGDCYAFDTSGGSTHNTGIRKFKLSPLVESRFSTAENSISQGHVDYDGNTHGSTGFDGTSPACVLANGWILVGGARRLASWNSQPYLVIDPDSLREIARCGVWGNTLTWPVDWTGPTPNMDFCTPVTPFGQYGLQAWALVANQVNTNPSLALLYAPQLDQGGLGGLMVAWSSTKDMPLETIPHLNGMCTGRTSDRFGYAYMVMGRNYDSFGAGTDNLQMWTIQVPPAPPIEDIIQLLIGAPGDTHGATVMMSIAKSVTGGVHDMRWSMAPGTVIPGETSLRNVKHLAYDKKADKLIFWAQADSDGQWYCLKVSLNGDTIHWRTAVDAKPSCPMNQCELENNLLCWHTAAGLTLIDTDTGELIIDNDPDYVPAGFVNVGQVGAYSSSHAIWVGLSGDDDSVVWKVQPGLINHNPANLDEVVADICNTVGLEAGDVDVTDLAADTVPGYAVARQMSARDALLPLFHGYFFDGYESDFKLKFKKRGGTVARTIPEAELTRNDSDAEAAVEVRGQEVELPMRITVTYMDKDMDYEVCAQHARRILRPTSTSNSKDEENIELAISSDADFAKQVAEKTLYTWWVERTGHQFGVGPKHVDLDPSDVVALALEDITIDRARIMMTAIGEGFLQEAGTLFETDGQYVSTATGDRGTRPPNEVPSQYTKTFILDCPLLVDSDDLPDHPLAPMYFAMATLDGRAWNSGTLWRHYATDELFESIGRSVDEATWGYITDILGDPATPHATDYDNSFTVRLVNYADDIASCTHAEMLAGANFAAILKTNGEIELINFENATSNADGTYTIDTLLRGRRGTDTMCYGHGSGEYFLLLNIEEDGDTYAIASKISELNASQQFKGVQGGADFAEAPIFAITPVGRSLMPYAPVNIHCTESGGDIVIDWTKRERVFGNLDTDDLAGARAEDVTNVALDGANPDYYEVANVGGFYVGSIIEGIGFTNPENNGYHVVTVKDTLNTRIKVANGELVAETPPANAYIRLVTTVEESIEFEIDIYDGPGVAAQAIFQLTDNTGLDGKTLEVASRTYTMQTVLTNSDGNILVGANIAATVQNIIAAITLGPGAGIVYAASTTEHPRVTAGLGAADEVVVTAKTKGTAGNYYELGGTITLTKGNWDTGTYMAGGVDQILKRTVTGLTEPTYTYTAAQQATDSFSGSELTLAIYMISATIGRGFGRVQTVGVS